MKTILCIYLICYSYIGKSISYSELPGLNSNEALGYFTAKEISNLSKISYINTGEAKNLFILPSSKITNNNEIFSVKLSLLRDIERVKEIGGNLVGRDFFKNLIQANQAYAWLSFKILYSDFPELENIQAEYWLRIIDNYSESLINYTEEINPETKIFYYAKLTDIFKAYNINVVDFRAETLNFEVGLPGYINQLIKQSSVALKIDFEIFYPEELLLLLKKYSQYIGPRYEVILIEGTRFVSHRQIEDDLGFKEAFVTNSHINKFTVNIGITSNAYESLINNHGNVVIPLNIKGSAQIEDGKEIKKNVDFVSQLCVQILDNNIVTCQ